MDRPHRQAPSAGVYRVVFRGRLEPSWAERFAGMKILPGDSGGPAGETILQGPVRDQAQLAGILNTIFDLHLLILRVELLDSE